MIIKQRLFLVLIITNLMIFAGQSVFAKDNSRYQFYTPTNEGTGKVYMGREIAHVMGFQGAAWLERESRQKEERTDLLLKSLDLKSGMAVADIGAGTGFLSRGMANLVGEKGRVFAVDIQPEMLGKLKKLQKTYPNITPVLASDLRTNLNTNSVDMAIMVDVYHELSYPYEVLQDTLQALKQNGQLVLVEYRAEDDAVPIKATHKMSEAQIIKELGVHGFVHKKTIHSLPWQHIVIFSKP